MSEVEGRAIALAEEQGRLPTRPELPISRWIVTLVVSVLLVDIEPTLHVSAFGATADSMRPGEATLAQVDHAPLAASPVPRSPVAAMNLDGMPYFVSADAVGGGDGSAANPWTLAEANATLQPGDHVYLRGGSYYTPIAPTRAAGSTKEIIYQAYAGETPVILEASDLSDLDYVTIIGIRFESDGHTWITTNQGTSHIQLLDSRFNSTRAGSWAGLRIRGGHFTIRHCLFGDWWDGDMILIYGGGGYVLIEESDFSQARGTHSLISGEGANNVIIRSSYFRNPWDRVLTFVWTAGQTSESVLVEDNVFIDSNWNGVDPHPESGSDRGATELIRFNVSRSILRNNLLAGTNQGKNYDYQSIFDGSTYGDVHHYQHLRIYHNTFYSNRGHVIRFMFNQERDVYVNGEDNRLKNNILMEHNLRPEYTDYAFYIPDAAIPWMTYRVEHNVIWDSAKGETLYLRDGGRSQSVQTAEASFPEVFAHNLTDEPRFQNPHLLDAADASPENYSLADRAEFFRAFTLTADSTGKQQAEPLTVITESATNSTRLRVEDALYFSDGFGMVPGDELQIVGPSGQVTARVVQRADDSTLVVDSPVTVSPGDRVFLARYGASPDIGIVIPGDIPSPTFADVPFEHPFHADIEALYRAGYTAGCSTDPLLFCPDNTMNRAEASVFVERGIHTASYDPPAPSSQVFADLALDSWAAKWIHGLWVDGYTAGCRTDPLVYCPWQGHTRAEGGVFYLRMLHGANFEPPQPTQQTFVDVPLDTWYARWVQAAYDAGLIEACQTAPELRFCPNEPLTRALAAHMMVQAKGLPLP